MTHRSEVCREELQAHISQSALLVSDHAADHKAYQDTLIQENSSLKTLIQALEAKAAQTLKDHNEALKALNEVHISKENANLETQNTLKKAHTDRANQMIKERADEQATHQAVVKAKADELAARDARYVLDLQKWDQVLKDTIKEKETRHAA